MSGLSSKQKELADKMGKLFHQSFNKFKGRVRKIEILVEEEYKEVEFEAIAWNKGLKVLNGKNLFLLVFTGNIREFKVFGNSMIIVMKVGGEAILTFDY